MYTLIAVYVRFNRFIDLAINSQTNPDNLASRRLLWVWAPVSAEAISHANLRHENVASARRVRSFETDYIYFTPCTFSRWGLF